MFFPYLAHCLSLVSRLLSTHYISWSCSWNEWYIRDFRLALHVILKRGLVGDTPSHHHISTKTDLFENRRNSAELASNQLCQRNEDFVCFCFLFQWHPSCSMPTAAKQREGTSLYFYPFSISHCSTWGNTKGASCQTCRTSIMDGLLTHSKRMSWSTICMQSRVGLDESQCFGMDRLDGCHARSQAGLLEDASWEMAGLDWMRDAHSSLTPHLKNRF